jgi:predicted lipid-binding transport protein (Tim44 family)
MRITRRLALTIALLCLAAPCVCPPGAGAASASGPGAGAAGDPAVARAAASGGAPAVLLAQAHGRSGDVIIDGPVRVRPQKPGITWYRWLRRLLLNGFIGNLLVSGRVRARFGLLELIVASAAILLVFKALSRYEPASVGEYAGGMGYGGAVPAVAADAPPDDDEASAPVSLEGGLESIRATDPDFDPAAFSRTVDRCFRAVQAAWTARDMRPAHHVLSVDLRERLQRECEALRAQGRINRVERIEIKRAAITAARQIRGWDRLTVHLEASLVDYTTNESGLNVLAGNPFDPVPFREQWDFVRPSGPHPWTVAAIR